MNYLKESNQIAKKSLGDATKYVGKALKINKT